MKKKINADPYGNDEEFRAYIKKDTLRTTVVLLAIVAIVLITVFSSCRTSEPCGTYSKWESKTPFRSK